MNKRKTKRQRIGNLLVGLGILTGSAGLTGYGIFAYRAATNPYDVNAPVYLEYRKTLNALGSLQGARISAQNEVSVLDDLEFLQPYSSEFTEERERRTGLLDNTISTTQKRLKELEGNPYISGRNAYQVTSNKFVNHGTNGLAAALLCFTSSLLLLRETYVEGDERREELK